MNPDTLDLISENIERNHDKYVAMGSPGEVTEDKD
jgi:hypothetical protein